MPNDELTRLAATRPAISPDLLVPDDELIEEILMSEPNTPKRRYVTPIRLGAAAALAAAAAAIAVTLPSDSPTTAKPGTTSQLALMNMRRIAESSEAALSSGRAQVTMRSDIERKGETRRSSAAWVVEFSGDNRSMSGTIDPGDERGSAFPFANKVVDGRFFLEDGTRWVEDTNANLSGGDVFSIDPRSFLAGVADAAQFEEVSPRQGATRHLRATKLDAIPDFNLGMGPRGSEIRVTGFELFVDRNDVVTGIVMRTKQIEDTYEGARAKLVKDENGNVRKVLDESTLGEPIPQTTTTTYEVTFTDIGSPITITPPPNAPKIAGQG